MAASPLSSIVAAVIHGVRIRVGVVAVRVVLVGVTVVPAYSTQMHNRKLEQNGKGGG